MATNISNQTLEQYLLKELPAERMQKINRLLEIDPELQQRVQALRQSNADILQTYTPKVMATGIRLRAAQNATPTKTRQQSFLLPTLSLAATAVVLFLAFPVLQNTFFPTAETTRFKGETAKLYIYHKTNNSVELLKNNTQAQPGDLLQIAYLSHRHKYGIILSIDGWGKITLHTPQNKNAAAKLVVNNKTPLPVAYELDDAPEFERFFLITSETALDVGSVLSAAQQLAENSAQRKTAPLDLPKSIKQISIVLKKGEAL